MWECLVGVRHRGCPISDTSASLSSLSIRNVSKADIPGSFGRRLLYVRGKRDDVDRFEGICGSHDRVTDLQLVSKNEGTEAYFAAEIEYDDDNPSILSLINERGMFHHGSIGVQEGVEQWLVYSDGKENIQELADAIESHDNRVTIYRMVDLGELGHISNIEQGLLLSQLTNQQQKTFQTALDMGYYDEDSDTIVSDIASALDRHETTTWEHLNKAENAILTSVGNQLFASRTVGRPHTPQ
jgi:predicted DNA binding protein